jgi:hypothetical protein
MTCHFFDSGVKFLFVFQTWMLQPVKWLIRAQMARQVEVTEDIPAGRMDAEERPK